MSPFLNSIHVALVGDYNSSVTAHRAIPKALEIASREVDCVVESTWVATDELEGDVESRLKAFGGVWCVPASPYKSMGGALAAIQWARERDIPFLGTCGGYQHAILEYARNVLHHSEADNAEVKPDASMPLIAPLSCALVEERADILLSPGSRVAKLYGAVRTTEQYHCSFGLNPRYSSIFDDSDLVITGEDSDRDPRVIELTNHRFFIGTAFQPERSALNGDPHPLVTGYVKSIAEALR